MRPRAFTPEQNDAILRLSTSGLTYKEVAARLGLGEQSVRNALSRGYRKLGLYGAGSRLRAALMLRERDAARYGGMDRA